MRTPTQVPDLIRETKLAWAAGFIDGEGHTAVTSSKWKGLWSHGIILSAPQAEHVAGETPEELVELKRLFGGSIYRRRQASTGQRTVWVWQAQSSAARRAIAQMWPYLHGAKRRQWADAVDERERRLAIGQAAWTADHAARKARREASRAHTDSGP